MTIPDFFNRPLRGNDTEYCKSLVESVRLIFSTYDFMMGCRCEYIAPQAVRHPATTVEGKIISVKAVAERITDGGDITIHLLKGPIDGAGALTCASNSVWNRRLYNDSGSIVYRKSSFDQVADINISADEAVTMGLVHAANGVEGLTLMVIFRSTAS